MENDDVLIQVLKSKIHRARVTNIDLNYSGSIGVDETLMEKAGIRENERVLVANLRNGRRWETYALREEAGSKKICVYGPAGRLCKVGDLLVVMSFGLVDEQERVRPKIVILDKSNEIAKAST